MLDYAKLYHMMVNASEDAIAAIDQHNYGQARAILIAAEQASEELYLRQTEDEPAALERKQTK